MISRTIFKTIISCTIIGSLLGVFLAISDLKLAFPNKSLKPAPIVAEARQELDVHREIILTAKKNNPRLSTSELLEIANSVYNNSLEFRLDYQLILAVIEQESHFRINAVSHKGAQGLMQIMPSTGQALARELELDSYSLTDIHTNITLGTYYLHQLFERFQDPHAALTAYNRGPTGLHQFVERTGSSRSSYSSSIMSKYSLSW